MTEEVVGGRGEGKRTFTSGGPWFWRVENFWTRSRTHASFVCGGGGGGSIGGDKKDDSWVGERLETFAKRL